MRRHSRVACIAAVLASLPASAQSSFTLVAKGAEELIRAYDSQVRDVTSFIPAPEGRSTACGEIGKGSLTAFYCPESRSIYITEKTLRAVGSSYGAEGVAVIVAHEFAHARLHAIQGFTRDIIWSSVIDEIQADCVAGVYFRTATPMPVTNKMVLAASNFLENIGNYVPLEKDWHGTPEMRKAAFLHGYNEGHMSSCIASDDSNINKIIQNPSGTLQNQLHNPQSELNRLIRWGRNWLRE